MIVNKIDNSIMNVAPSPFFSGMKINMSFSAITRSFVVSPVLMENANIKDGVKLVKDGQDAELNANAKNIDHADNGDNRNIGANINEVEGQVVDQDANPGGQNQDGPNTDTNKNNHVKEVNSRVDGQRKDQGANHDKQNDVGLDNDKNNHKNNLLEVARQAGLSEDALKDNPQKDGVEEVDKKPDGDIIEYVPEEFPLVESTSDLVKMAESYYGEE
jgi:hypothetical protein